MAIGVRTAVCLVAAAVMIIGGLVGSTSAKARFSQFLRGSSSSQHLASQEVKRRLDYGTTEAPLAQTALHLKFQLQKILDAQGGFKEEPTPGAYTEEDAVDIMKSLRNAHDMLEGFWQVSGKTALNHAIGAASCMLLAKAPATYVSAALLHTVHLTYWQPHTVGESSHPAWTDDVCPRRRFLQQRISNKTEAALWRHYTAYSGSDEARAPALWHKLLDDQEGRLPSEDKYLILVDICDDIEQFQHDEQLFANNARNHDKEYTAELLSLLDRLEQDADMQAADLQVLKPFVQRVYKQAEEWFFEKPSGVETDLQVRDTMELAFRNAAEAPVSPIAHQPHIRRSILWCRAPENQELCVKHWSDIVAFWGAACCDREEGPCDAPSTRAGRQLPDLPRAKLGLPEVMPKVLAPKLTPHVAGKTLQDLHRSPERFIEEQKQMLDLPARLEEYKPKDEM